MDVFVFSIVLLAAFLHATWNFAARKVEGNTSVLWLGISLAAVCCLPFALWCVPDARAFTEGIPYIVATGVVHAVYFSLLARSYEVGEISTVYPVARGTGVIGTALAASVVLQENISALGATGIAVVCMGIVLIGAQDLRLRRKPTATRLALGVGASIMVYSVIDKTGVGVVHPVFYIFGMFLLTALLMAPLVVRGRYGQCRHAMRYMKRYIALIGLGSMGTYLLILFAYQLGRVSYIVAARESSVAVGAMLGIVFLKEKCTMAKGLGVIAITAGLFIIKGAP